MENNNSEVSSQDVQVADNMSIGDVYESGDTELLEALESTSEGGLSQDELTHLMGLFPTVPGFMIAVHALMDVSLGLDYDALNGLDPNETYEAVNEIEIDESDESDDNIKKGAVKLLVLSLLRSYAKLSS